MATSGVWPCEEQLKRRDMKVTGGPAAASCSLRGGLVGPPGVETFRGKASGQEDSAWSITLLKN